MWGYLLGYAIFVAVFAAVVLWVRPQWRGPRVILASAAIGPILVIVATILLLSVADPDSWMHAMLRYLWVVPAIATLLIGALVSLLVSAIWRTLKAEAPPRPD